MYRVLDVASVYNFAQVILAPGQHSRLTRVFRATAARLPSADRVLDVGCGPASWLWRLGLHPIGLDITPSYTARFAAAGELAVTASATAIPFPDRAFSQVWCFGLLHHLTDDAARAAVAEMRRVTSPSGAVVVMDAVLPHSAWRRPLAYGVRKLDRGGHVRAESHHRALLGEGWTVTREEMAYNGLEVTVAVLVTPA